MPIFTIPTPFGQVPVGNARAGVCGGMVFAAIDHFSHARPVPRAPTPDVFRYLVRRLWASWNVPFGGGRYFTWQGRRHLGRRTADREWPKVRAELDAGRLAPLGVVTVFSRDPRRVGRNHQVLAYGYDLGPGERSVAVNVYDPNYPGDDGLTLTLGLGGPDGRPVVHGIEGPTVRGFFLTRYRPPRRLPEFPTVSREAPPSAGEVPRSAAPRG